MSAESLPPSYILDLLPERYAVCRLPEGFPEPDWAKLGVLQSTTRRSGEMSIVCAERFVPPDIKTERGWRVLQVLGPLDFALCGVLSSLLAPLARGEIGVFVLSTFDTDLVLVKEANLARAIQVLEQAGHIVRQPRD